MQHRVTQKQFDNILKFLLTMQTRVIEHSPDYILEKFERFIGEEFKINDYPEKGLHKMLELAIPAYHKRWKPEFATLVEA